MNRVAQVGSSRASTGSLSRRLSSGPDPLPFSLEYLVNTSTFHTGVGAVLFPDVQLGDEIVWVTRGCGGDVSFQWRKLIVLCLPRRQPPSKAPSDLMRLVVRQRGGISLSFLRAIESSSLSGVRGERISRCFRKANLICLFMSPVSWLK